MRTQHGHPNSMIELALADARNTVCRLTLRSGVQLEGVIEQSTADLQCGFCLGIWQLLPPIPDVGPGGRIGLHSALFRSARQPATDCLGPVDLDEDLDDDDDDG